MPIRHLSAGWRRLGYVAIACAFIALPLSAAAGAETPQDTAAVHAVTLSTDLLHRMSQAIGEANAAMANSEDSVMVLTDDDGHPRTVAALTAEVDANPATHAALLRHHLDARQFVLTSLALIDGYSAALQLQSHTTVSTGDVPAAHLRFCQQHMAEIAAMYASP
ncbi:hypothetical protein [Rhodanobacter lindaniclasticus]